MTVEDSIELTVKGCGVELYDIVNFKENDILIYRIYISSKDGISSTASVTGKPPERNIDLSITFKGELCSTMYTFLNNNNLLLEL